MEPSPLVGLVADDLLARLQYKTDDTDAADREHRRQHPVCQHIEALQLTVIDCSPATGVPHVPHVAHTRHTRHPYSGRKMLFSWSRERHRAQRDI